MSAAAAGTVHPGFFTAGLTEADPDIRFPIYPGEMPRSDRAG